MLFPVSIVRLSRTERSISPATQGHGHENFLRMALPRLWGASRRERRSPGDPPATFQYPPTFHQTSNEISMNNWLNIVATIAGACESQASTGAGERGMKLSTVGEQALCASRSKFNGLCTPLLSLCTPNLPRGRRPVHGPHDVRSSDCKPSMA
jgi:hypothetical protein